MKTIKEVDLLIRKTITHYRKGLHYISEEKHLEMIAFLTMSKRYLETNPRKGFIEEEIVRLQNKLNIINSCKAPVYYLIENDSRTQKTYCDIELGGKRISKQLSTLNFFLKAGKPHPIQRLLANK